MPNRHSREKSVGHRHRDAASNRRARRAADRRPARGRRRWRRRAAETARRAHLPSPCSSPPCTSTGAGMPRRRSSAAIGARPSRSRARQEFARQAIGVDAAARRARRRRRCAIAAGSAVAMPISAMPPRVRHVEVERLLRASSGRPRRPRAQRHRGRRDAKNAVPAARAASRARRSSAAARGSVPKRCARAHPRSERQCASSATSPAGRSSADPPQLDSCRRPAAAARRCRRAAEPVKIARLREVVYAHAVFHDLPAHKTLGRAKHCSHPVQLLLKFLTRLPLPVLYELSRALFRVAYYVFRWRRPLAAANLRNAFPEKTRGRARRHPQAIVPQSREPHLRNAVRLRRQRGGDAAPRAHRESRAARQFTEQRTIGRAARRAFLQLGMAVADRRHAARHPDRRRLQAAARRRLRPLPARRAVALRRQSHPAPTTSCST